MRLPTQRQKPRVAQNAAFPAPIGGWIANRSKALARAPNLPPGAAILENWFPTATGCKLRRGSQRWATVGEGVDPVLSLFTYNVGSQEQFFAATRSTIYDVTTVSSPYNYTIGTEARDEIGVGNDDVLGAARATQIPVQEGNTGGDWVTVQFSTDGGTFLRGVNGRDAPFVYDGGAFTNDTPAYALTFEDGEQAEPQDMSYVWTYKRRMFFIRGNTLDAYYLPVNQIGGKLSVLPLGSIFPLGGALLFGASWSLGTSDQGGLSAQCVFVTTEGEVAVYQGDDPDTIESWALVGVYRIGRPLGKKAHISAGGDIVIATSIGFLPLSEAVQREYAALSPAAVSNPIEDAWTTAVTRRSAAEWHCVTWPDGQMVVVAPPAPATDTQKAFAANANTGAWASFTGWNIRCMTVFRGQLFFGSDFGAVVRAYVGGSDQGTAYTGKYLGLFDDMGSVASRKIVQVARVTLQSSVQVNPTTDAHFDWLMDLPPAPDAEVVIADNVWDSAIWNRAIWDTNTDAFVYQAWNSVGGSGARMAPSVQITSGATVPIDAELVSVDVTYTTADIVT